MRIGITGYGKSGKDVVADVLVKDYGFVKVNMSDALDKYLRILNPIIGMTTGSDGKPLAVRYRDYVEAVGYVEAKNHPEVRELLQRMGTDVGRAIDPEMWVKEMEKEAAKHEHVVTTGIRFVEEHARVDHMIHVNRPGYGPVNDHVSDQLDHIFALADTRIDNDGPLVQCEDRTRIVASGVLGLRVTS